MLTPVETGYSIAVVGVRIYLQAVEIAAELSGGMSGKAEPDDVPILPHK